MNNNLFQDYPDVVNFDDMRTMLGSKDKKLGKTTAYKLIHNKRISH